MKILCPRPCIVCGQPSYLEVDDELAARIVAWANNRQQAIQVALPELSAAEREQLISGTHGACFDALYDGL